MSAQQKRLALGAILAVVGANLAIYVVNLLIPGPSGKPSSSLGTTPRGFAGWAELARRNGVEVVALRDDLRDADLPDGATVVALDVPRLARADARALRDFVRAGGRVVAGGRRPSRWLSVLDPDLSWSPGGPRAASVGDRRLALDGRGSWSGRDRLLVRRGDLELLADSSPLQNERLARADNAAFALDLAGEGPLVFAEAAHGYGSARGLAALPGRAKGALIILLLAALLLMFARGRRFGPVEAEGRELAPPRVAYVDALAATLARTKDRAGALEPLRAAVGDDEPRPETEADALALARRHADMMRA